MPSVTDTTGRRQFGRHLARLRTERQISAPALAPLLGISQPTLSKIEHGKLLPSRQVLQRLARALKLSAQERVELLERAEAMLGLLHRVELAHEQGYTRIQKLVSLLEFKTFACFRLSLVPGPLQAEPYVRSLFCPGGVRPTADVERAIQERLTQTRRLADPARQFRFVLHDNALRTRVAPPEVMADQILHVEQSMGLDHVEVRLLSPDLDYHELAIEPPQSSFDLFDRDLLAVDLNGCWLNLEDRMTLARYASYFEALWTAALDEQATRAALRRLRREFARMANRA